MKLTIPVILALTALTTVTLSANQRPYRGEDRKAAKQQRKYEKEQDAARIAADIRFSIGEVRVIREYYEPRYRSLPPGLQKKVQRGGQLPPGWRKKMERFPPKVERQLTALPRGYSRGVIDGHAVIYDTRSHAVIDVAILF